MIKSAVSENIRPEWLDAVDGCWLNWRFLAAAALPVLIFILAGLRDLRWRFSFPVAVAACWFFCSWGILNVSDVMVNHAVTDDEMGLATSDTGRVFSTILLVPILAFVYTLAVLPVTEAVLRIIFCRPPTPIGD